MICCFRFLVCLFCHCFCCFLLLFIFFPTIYIFLGYTCQIRFLSLVLSISYFLGFTLNHIAKNHILAESSYFKNHIEWAQHMIMDLKPANKYKIIWQSNPFRRDTQGFIQRILMSIIWHKKINPKTVF